MVWWCNSTRLNGHFAPTTSTSSQATSQSWAHEIYGAKSSLSLSRTTDSCAKQNFPFQAECLYNIYGEESLLVAQPKTHIFRTEFRSFINTGPALSSRSLGFGSIVELFIRVIRCALDEAIIHRSIHLVCSAPVDDDLAHQATVSALTQLVQNEQRRCVYSKQKSKKQNKKKTNKNRIINTKICA